MLGQTLDILALGDSRSPLADAIEALAFYMEQGGWVMPWLAVTCVLMWFALGYRYSVTRRPEARSVRRLIDKYQAGSAKKPKGLIERAVVRALAIRARHPRDLRRRLDDALYEDAQELKRFTRLIRATVAAAPLLGLLGTVDGMIETFESLADMAFFARSGGIAGGISQALFTTQLGLTIAVPGLIVHGAIERRARSLTGELAQIKDILCGNEPKRSTRS